MRSYLCSCGSRIFNDNVQCIACGSELGFCPQCQALAPITASAEGGYQCGNPGCGAALQKCVNYVEHHVCNRCLPPEQDEGEGLCSDCRFNTTIPDLSIPANRAKWSELESAKRRLLYDLRVLRLPLGTHDDGVRPPLYFAFKDDAISPKDKWRAFRKSEKVYTSHNAGLVTINIQEADPVEREKLRVNFEEPHRTVIGHFRHEIGHYYWDVLIRGRREQECAAVFGDHLNPAYGDALATYYQSGPPANWRDSFVSAYATMHPWEDFAETWAVYLDLTSTLETAAQNGFPGEADPLHADLDQMVLCLQALTISLNEINRNQGLPDVIPEIYLPAVVAKLRYLHQLVQENAGGILPPLAPPAAAPLAAEPPHDDGNILPAEAEAVV